MRLISVIIRVLQAIFAIVVLGLSVDLARGQAPVLKAPAITSYAAFTGGLGVLVAIVGVTSLFVSSLEGIIMLALDALSGLASLAGGIAFAVILGGIDCSDYTKTWNNQILSGGCEGKGKNQECFWAELDYHKLQSRCTSAKADDAFMFIGFVVCAGAVVYSFFSRGKSSAVSYA